MAVFGINFNRTEIPVGIQRRFARRLKLPGMTRFEWATLQGVATTWRSKEMMLIQASNGSRSLHVEKRQVTNGTAYPRTTDTFYGIYVYYKVAKGTTREI